MNGEEKNVVRGVDVKEPADVVGRRIYKVGEVIDLAGIKATIYWEKGAISFVIGGIMYVMHASEFLKIIRKRRVELARFLYREGIRKIIYITKNKKQITIDLQNLIERKPSGDSSMSPEG